MKVHVLSDLHLEVQSFELVKQVECDVLVLAGDIGSLTVMRFYEFIAKAASLYKHVLFVAGNHEVYNFTISRAFYKLSKLCKRYDNVIFLNRKSYDIENIRFVGTTLWTQVQDEQRHDVERMADYTSILEWSIEKNNRSHELDVNFIKQEITKAKQEHKQLVVITHHAPSLNTSRPEHVGSSVSSAFATDLEYLIADPIITWIHGHTHRSGIENINGVKLVSNQRGHSDQVTHFSTSFISNLEQYTHS